MFTLLAEEVAKESALAAPPIVYGLVVLGISLFGLLVTLAYRSIGTRH